MSNIVYIVCYLWTHGFIKLNKKGYTIEVFGVLLHTPLTPPGTSSMVTFKWKQLNAITAGPRKTDYTYFPNDINI